MVELPMSVRLLWGLEGAGTRGPKRTVSVEQVVDAAIEVCDAEGVAALSMSRLAKQLGFTTMALYRYIDTKDTLITLVQDRVMGLPPALPVEQGWRPALEAWAWAEFRAIRQHSWWLDLPLGRPPAGPYNMAWLESGLAAFADTGVPEAVKLQLVLNLSFYVIGRVRLITQIGNAQDDEDNFTLVLTQVLDPAVFPAITSALSHQAFGDDSINWEEADFGFALDRLLDGYDKLVKSYTR